MPELLSYDRQAAVRYARRWAHGRNPAYYDFDALGGDCTNFASQCLYTGTGVMNFDPVYGWYYIDGSQKAPAWTGVPYFYNFITREEVSPGPFGLQASLWEVEPGDFVQLRFSGERFGHTPVIVEVGEPPRLGNILVAAHSIDADYRPLDSYTFQELRFLHILGAYPPAGGEPEETGPQAALPDRIAGLLGRREPGQSEGPSESGPDRGEGERLP